MYRVTIFGKTPGSLAGLAVLLRERQNLCRLEWFQMLQAEARDKPGFDGPINKAPTGLYEVWHDAPGHKDGFFLVDLVVLDDVLLLGDQVIQRLGVNLTRLDEATRKSFEKLMTSSEKELVVYENEFGDRAYLMVWPDHVKHLKPEHGDKPGYRLLGVANLTTGVISVKTELQ